MLNEKTKRKWEEECQRENFREYNIEGKDEQELSIRATKSEWWTVVEVDQEREASGSQETVTPKGMEKSTAVNSDF